MFHVEHATSEQQNITSALQFNNFADSRQDPLAGSPPYSTAKSKTTPAHYPWGKARRRTTLTVGRGDAALWMGVGRIRPTIHGKLTLAPLLPRDLSPLSPDPSARNGRTRPVYANEASLCGRAFCRAVDRPQIAARRGARPPLRHAKRYDRIRIARFMRQERRSRGANAVVRDDTS